MNIFSPATTNSLKTIAAQLSPQDCALCGWSSRKLVCRACEHGLPRAAVLACPRCAIELNTGGSAETPCGACLVELPHFDHTITAFRYDFPLDRLLQAYKFRAHLTFTKLLADALAARIKANRLLTQTPLPDLIMPTPLAAKRLAERGFNQSALLGREVARHFGIHFSASGLRRMRETRPQTGLKRDERLKNVQDAFACVENVAGKHIAIVDDVMTTGATLSEAAKVLKQNGAAYVEAWACARATHH